jgi:hypothetical protein
VAAGDDRKTFKTLVVFCRRSDGDSRQEEALEEVVIQSLQWRQQAAYFEKYFVGIVVGHKKKRW